jgi:hypothetical protein
VHEAVHQSFSHPLIHNQITFISNERLQASLLNLASTCIDLFNIPENTYQGTLRSPLTPLSNLGLSGSLFYHTSAPPPPLLPEDIAQQHPNAGLFIKSIGHAFEYEFMYEKLLPEYLTFMRDSRQHGGSLLSRITDVLCSRETSIGALLKMTPRYYMVMVDIIGSKKKKASGRRWDLKPPEFFEVRNKQYGGSGAESLCQFGTLSSLSLFGT